MDKTLRNLQYYKFSAYGFLKNLRFFDAFLMLFLLEKGMSYSEIGIMYAVKEVALNLVEIPSGIFADTWGRKRTLAGSFVFYIISFSVFYFSNSFVLFLLAFALFGVGDAFRTGTHKGMMMDYLKMNDWGKHKTMYYGHTRAWSQRGLAISSLIGGLIVFQQGNFEVIFLYSIIPYLLNLLLLMSYPAKLNYSRERQEKSRWSDMKATFTDFWEMVKRPAVFALITNTAAHSAFQKAIKDYIQPVMVAAITVLPFLTSLEEKQREGIFIGIIYFVIYLLTSRASSMAGLVKEKSLKSLAIITLLAGLIAGLLCGVLYGFEYWWWALLFFTVVYLVENFRKPIMTGLVADEVPNEILASVLSAQSQLQTVITVLIALMIGFVADLWGVGVAITAVSLILGLIVLFIQWYKKSNK
ncbi:MAG: MFS transporter [Prolixibacteraceae bacterium]|nr:MFS transporter [Prolixibacteraceae bacterium]